MKTLLAYLNGDWLPASDLKIDVDDVGFLLGATVTERLRTFGGQVFRLAEHLRRMHRSLEIIGLGAEAITAKLAHVIPEFVSQNAAQIAPDDDWTIIAFVTPGVAGRNVPTICVHGWPLQFCQWAADYELGISVFVSDVRQVPDNCWPSELKCRSRMHYYLADTGATVRMPGARAILLDQAGDVAESTNANVLVYREMEGLSSPPDDNILVGITLGVIHELAGRLGIPLMRRRIAPDELRSADELMLASTSVCLLPVVACNGQTVGTGLPGPTFQRLIAAWCDLVGYDVVAQARKYADRP